MSDPVWHRESPRRPWWRRNLAVLVVAAVLLVAVVVATQIPQRRDIARIGETQTLAISKTSRVTADITVDLAQSADGYEILASTSNPDADLNAYTWRLLDSAGGEHEATASVDCDVDACVTFSVPADTEITMVRWYGVDRYAVKARHFLLQGWAGWEL